MEERHLDIGRLYDMVDDPMDIERLVRHPKSGQAITQCLRSFPHVVLTCEMQPITRSILRVMLFIKPEFVWKEHIHGQSMRWNIWVEDSEMEHMYHFETWTLTRRMYKQAQAQGDQQEPLSVSFTIPIFEPLPSQYYIRCVHDSWHHAEAFVELRLQDLILPEHGSAHTALLDLDPLPRSALQDPSYESMYSFGHFNPIQTQAFHVLYHSDESVLMGAPTGSGKTIMSELAMLRVFRHTPRRKVLYIAPLKALVRERMSAWGSGLCKSLNKRMVELTGDHTPDMRALLSADIMVCTPEKWDGISRSWKARSYVASVGLIVIDEIHLLGQDRGPVLEVIVSRMRNISIQTGAQIRFVGLSTALANAGDLGAWLGVSPRGLFNFKPSVRPVPMEVHIQGYPGKHYCPRMATMNKPTYAAIQLHSPLKPVLVFVSSRRQTRLTALDLIAFAAADENPRAFLMQTEVDDPTFLEGLDAVVDPSLRHTLQVIKKKKLLRKPPCTSCLSPYLTISSTSGWSV
jgi:activating signal cointegrator complex subunit 3